MSNKDILEKAIQKAIDGGWDNEYWAKRYKLANELDELEYLFNDETPSIESVIFDHEFARALWGEGQSAHAFRDKHGDGYHWYPDWQYQLQQMVVAPDPIKYLGEHLEEKV